MSFRSKVLDALDIKKDHVRIPVYQTFNNPASDVAAVTGTSASDLGQAVTATPEPYAVSKCIRRNIIGPQNRAERLEVLGFVVGDDPGTTISTRNPLMNGFLQSLPDCIDRGSTDIHTGFHYLGGIYDSSNPRLQVMRKSAIMPLDEQTQYAKLTDAGAVQTLVSHSHTDWPSTAHEQAVKLSENSMADALYYHKTQLRFLLTGIDDVGTSASGDQASNHRGTVRMLVLRNRTPAIRTRVEGSTGQFILNHGYMPNWDTELFYDKNKQLGGKLATTIEAHTSEREYNLAQSNNANLTDPQRAAFLAKYNHNIDEPTSNGVDSEVSVPYGLHLRESANRPLMNAPNSVHFGHFSPTPGSVHGLTPTDILMSKINKDKYAVLHDEVFTLDSLHHGAASQHIANVSIPYYKKVRFAGRQVLYNADGTVKDDLANHTNDEPMNLSSRPIVLFLSYNQKISASVEGFTAISEC
jgi:hypothetical protein